MSSNELDALLRNERPAMPSNMPWSVAQRMEETLQALPTRDALKRGTQRIRRLAIAAASIAVIGGAVASFVLLSKDKPSEIANLPPESTVEQQAEFIRTPMLGSLVHDSNVNKNGPSVTDQGITLMVRDVIYDGSEMAIRYSVKSEKELDDFMIDASVTIDSRKIGKVGYLSSDELGSLAHRYEKIDSGQYEGYINTWKLSYGDYHPDSLLLKFEATRIGNQSGKWSLDIPVSKTPDITVVPYDLSVSAKEGTLELDRIVLSPVTTQIHYDFIEGELDRTSWLGVEVTDEKGVHYGGHIADNVGALGNLYLSPVTNGAKTLILRPFYDDFRNNEKIEIKDLYHTPMLRQPTEDEPLVLPLGEGREMYITGLEYLADKTVVHSKSTSVSGGFSIQDENGKLLPVLSFGSDGSVEFKPIPEDAKLTFLTRPTYPRTYIPKLELRVDLPQR